MSRSSRSAEPRSQDAGPDRARPICGRGTGDTTPGEWSSCERIRVAAVDQATADELGAAWRERRSVTVELTPGLGLDDPEVPPTETVTGHQPWEWPIDLDLVGERLHHAVWANSIDARAGTQRRRWHWADVACDLGANITDTGADICYQTVHPPSATVGRSTPRWASELTWR